MRSAGFRVADLDELLRLRGRCSVQFESVKEQLILLKAIDDRIEGADDANGQRHFLSGDFPIGARQGRAGGGFAELALAADFQFQQHRCLKRRVVRYTRRRRERRAHTIFPNGIKRIGAGDDHAGGGDAVLLAHGGDFRILLQSQANGGVQGKRGRCGRRRRQIGRGGPSRRKNGDETADQHDGPKRRFQANLVCRHDPLIIWSLTCPMGGRRCDLPATISLYGIGQVCRGHQT